MIHNEEGNEITIDQSRSIPSSRPISGNHRPQSAQTSSSSSSRPRSALANNPAAISALQEVETNIRKITKQIKVLQRERIVREALAVAAAAAAAAAAAESEKKDDSRPTTGTNRRKESTLPIATESTSNENTIDPILDLEDERHKLVLKYESLSVGLGGGGKSYQPSSEAMIWDFCELFFDEFNFPSEKRNYQYLLKYYDPQASMNIVGYKTFTTRETIVNILLNRYEGLDVKYEVKAVKVDKDSMPGCFLSANVMASISIENDQPRKVLQMLHFVKTTELGPFDYVIKKEFFVVQDARPLYHHAEEPPPLSSLEIEYRRLKELKLQEEKERLLKAQMEEEGASYDEEDEDGDGTVASGSLVSGAASPVHKDERSQASKEKGKQEESNKKSAGDSVGAQSKHSEENDDLSVDSALKSKH